MGEKLETIGRNDGTVFICGKITTDASLPPVNKIPTPNNDKIGLLLQYARRLIKGQCDKQEQSSGPFVLSCGRDFRPCVKPGVPLIGRLCPTKFHKGEKLRPNGVYVNYGHGMFGLTLAPGSGRLLSQLVIGEKPDIPVDDFAPPKARLFETPVENCNGDGWIDVQR